jgi:thiamine-phosphate pyrophosphorylase
MPKLTNIPRLYAIADTSCFPSTAELVQFCTELVQGGVTLLQYRSKKAASREMLSQARELRRALGDRVALIMNDRADLCLAAGFDGVHLGQDDLSPEAARQIVGANRIVGISTHNPEQVREADALPIDYIAVGPVFATSTKENPDPVIGLEGVRRARALTRKPLVAIGGVTRENWRQVIEAGADSVAIISDLLKAPQDSARAITTAK